MEQLDAICNLIGQRDFDHLASEARSKNLELNEYVGYRSRQEVELADTNSYSNSTIRFNGLQMQDQFVDYSNTRFRIPYSLVSSCPSTVASASVPAGHCY